MLREKLENEIHQYIYKTGKDVDVIIMHPKAWQELVEEVFSKDSLEIERYAISVKYRGIRVIRSLDVGESEIIAR